MHMCSEIRGAVQDDRHAAKIEMGQVLDWIQVPGLDAMTHESRTAVSRLDVPSPESL